MQTPPLPTYEPVPLPPLTRRCCNTAYGPIDYAMFLFELLSAGGAAAAAAKEDYQTAGICTGAFGCLAIGHGLIRKYGNVAGIVNRFNGAQAQFHQEETELRSHLDEARVNIDGLARTAGG